MDRHKIGRMISFQVLSRDNLLKIFSFLPPASLARCRIVCKSWNFIIKSSGLWQSIYQEFKRQLKLVGNEAAKPLCFQHGETETVADWEAQFVKEQHRALIVFGSVIVKDWRGHSGRVVCCRLRLGTIVTGSSDGTVRVWSTATLQCLETYKVPNKSPVLDMEFDEDKILAISGTDIYIWNRRRGRVLRHMGKHAQQIHSLCFVDPEVFVGCADGTIRVFDVYSSRCIRIFRQHTERVSCVVVGVDSSLLASGSADGTVQLCDSLSGQKIGCLLPSSPPTGVNCLHLYQGCSSLAGGTTTGQVYAWDMRSFKLLWSARIGPNSVTSLHSQHYDATALVVGNINGVITILDSEFGTILRQYAPSQVVGHTFCAGVLVDEHVGVHLESSLENIPWQNRPSILCLRTGMTNLVTTHPDGRIQLWCFQP